MSNGASTSAVNDLSTTDPAPATEETVGLNNDRAAGGETAPQPQAPPKTLDPALKKRDDFLRELLTALDTLVYIELATVYYLDTSTLLLLLRALLYFSQVTVPHVTLQNLPATLMYRKPPFANPNTPLLLAASILCFAIHALTAAPVTSELTRFHLHGSLIVDFVGQYAVGGVWARMRLCVLDVVVILVQGLACAVALEKQRGTEKTAATGRGTENAFLISGSTGGPTAEGRAVSEPAFGLDEDPTAIELQSLPPRRQPSPATSISPPAQISPPHTSRSSTTSNDENNDNAADDEFSHEHSHLLPAEPASIPLQTQHQNNNNNNNEPTTDEPPNSNVQALETLYSGQASIAELHLLDMVRASFWEQRNRRLRGTV